MDSKPKPAHNVQMEAVKEHEVGTLPCFRTYNGVSFPVCISAKTTALQKDPELLAAWAAGNRTEIEALLHKHGAILLRGFGSETASPETFASFVEDGLALPNFPYALGNAVRTPIVGTRVFTANESPPDKPIPWHHELAQTPSYPERILFYCDVAPGPGAGGATPLLLSTMVLAELAKRHPQFVNKLETEGVVYSRVMTKHDRAHSAIGRGWAATFGSDDPHVVEKTLKTRGYTWEWRNEAQDEHEAPLLREISPVLDAVKHVSAGRKAFFNQIVAVWNGWRDEFNEPRNCVRFGDGQPLDDDAMTDATRIMQTNGVTIEYQRGDILYIDNLQVQHSRQPFTGRRRVLASLAKAPMPAKCA